MADRDHVQELTDALADAVRDNELDEDTALAILETPHIQTCGNNILKIETCRFIRGRHAARTIDGVFVDALTAQAIVLVYDALSEAKKAHYLTLDIGHMGRIAWKLVK
jgi:hypothetical protein